MTVRSFLTVACVSFLGLAPAYSAEQNEDPGPQIQIAPKETKGTTTVDEPPPTESDRAERSSAIGGSGYTVLGRTFLGESGNLSYLRFLNLSGSSATVNATLVGSPSGRNYGTAQVSVPNNASRQISINQLLANIGASGLTGTDTRLAAYLQSGSEPVAIQHVLYSSVNGFFENLSSCQNSSVSDGNSALVNVHTTRIADYTSFINIHNFGDTTTTYDIDIYNSETGANIGRVPVTIEPNTTFEQPFSYFETQLSFTPETSMFHANMVAFPRSGARTSSITHTVYNARLAAYLNLTNFCTVSPTLSGLPVANDDNIPVSSTSQSFTIPFETLIANDSNAASASLIGVTQPRTNGTANGSLAQSGNTLTYTPARDGLATFEYRLRNTLGDSSIATVTLNIGDGNDGGDDNTAYTLTTSKSGSGAGTVTSSPAGIDCGTLCPSRTYDFNSGTTVTLSATPTSGSPFIGWGGACSGTTTVCNVVMSSDQTVTASFGPSVNTLTVSKITIASGTGTGGGSGTVTSSAQPGISCGSDCSFGFTPGSSVTLTATPASGSTFLGWGGACTGTGLCNVVMSANQTVTASFGVPNYNLTVVKSGSGSVTSSQQPGISCGSTCTYAFNSGTTVSLTATPASGLNRDFRGWSGCASTSGENGTICNVLISSDKTVTASFAASTFTLSVTRSGTGSGSSSNGGSSGLITSSPPGIDCGTPNFAVTPPSSICSFAFATGTSVTLILGAGNGTAFFGWTGSCSGTGNCTVLMNSNQTAIANYR